MIDEINDSHATALQAVRLLAVYLSRTSEREQCVETVTEWLADNALAANATVQLIAATIFSHEGNMVDALKCCHTGRGLHSSISQLNLSRS